MPKCAIAHIVSKLVYLVIGNLYKDKGQFLLIDSVILDSRTTVYVFNDRSRFENNFCIANLLDVYVARSHVVLIEG